MAELQKLERLSAPHCVLLAVHYANESNIIALRALTALRDTNFDVELVLQILLTYLPEGVEPSAYVEYLSEIASDSRTPGEDPAAALDVSPVEELSNPQARKERRKLDLLQIAHPLYKVETDLDPLTHFLIHRAHRIDSEAGLLNTIPELVVPFVGHSEYIRTWLISTVLPLLRLTYEYYPQSTAPSLDEFARLKGRRAIDVQLANLRQIHTSKQGGGNAARDLRGVVGPWMCGANERKRRKLSPEDRRASISEEPDDWECLFEWLAHTSKSDFSLVSSAITEWDGPEDLDLGGFEEGRDYVDDETQRRLERRYAQTALACLYLVDTTNADALQAAHGLLSRLSDLLGLEPPAALSVNAQSLPRCTAEMPMLQELRPSAIQEENLTRPDNTLTQPNEDAVHVLELFLFSTCVLSSLQQSMSIRVVTRLFLRNDSNEQLLLLQKIIHALSTSAKLDAEQWRAHRSHLLWLWNWGSTQAGTDRYAQGVFGCIQSNTIETEILKGLLESSQYPLIVQLYIRPAGDQYPLPLVDVEQVILSATLHHYDNASNGNRTRGGMKRASDIITGFKPHFPNSDRFLRIEALLKATHAMSFYSLILQHGVPFQPVNIRVSADPLSFIKKLLDQNLRSYTHLDDLISIGQNLVVAMPATILDDDAKHTHLDAAVVERKKAAAERRVIGMTVEAALTEDDFETAYSYVVNRLTPSTPSPVASPSVSTSSQRFSFGSYNSNVHEDEGEDIAWRAALQAGRHRSSPSTSSSWTRTNTAARPDLRRLEQRMELLSQALLLAPPRHLEEVLAVWQECETEMTNLLAEETEAEERFNDAADRRLPGAFAEAVAIQPRREVGRGAVEEAPMGLFDVARGAAAAFSKSAFPLRGSGSNSRVVSGAESHGDAGRVSMDIGSDSGSIHSNGDERLRKRDMVANAVTGGLASGLGWVLGATPVNERP
ncbi:secretory pathway Sec39 [Bimuria novae-zelandiae CBS 107.79]|uniref:Secretory pathway Sec39 n=1 Tax=Bimuria novae-zelandiae CBS 107.79 TaxID=1447943 RepID=A0A6A5UWC2_9PLEO|nr:secretory pathway Sec39 [Bimuria novae-zelandiae CBS 107.79]